jgi:UTP-glucose-1-phosphate uridylyltransferase
MGGYVFRKEVFAALRPRNKMYGDVCLKEIIWKIMSSEKMEAYYFSIKCLKAYILKQKNVF